MIVNIVNAAQSIYQSFNFFVLFFTNKLFAQELKSIILRGRADTGSIATNSRNGVTRNDQSSRRNTLRKSTLKTFDA